MFETSVVRVQTRTADRRLGLLTLSVAAHAAVIASIIAASVATVKLPDRAPDQMSYPVFERLPPALGSPDARPAQQPPRPQPQTPRAPAPQTVVAPQLIPTTTEAAAASNAAATNAADSASTGGGEQGPLGVPWGSPGGVGVDGPPATSTITAGPVRAGVGDVKAPVVLRRVEPPYPPTAIRIRLNGFVIVECIIDRSGVVRDAKVVQSSSKLFEQPALDAVQQWRFTPGTLYGQPVDTIFDLTVKFQIGQ